MNAIPEPLAASREVQLWVGPQHPGVPGNMAMQIWVEGDTINRGITHVGYLHRAFEKLIERRTFYQAFPVVCRICVPEPDTNEYLLAAAVEELAGISGDVPPRAQWIRTLVLEMSRLAALLMVVGGQAGGMGLGAAPQWMIALRDYVLDLFEELSGGRVYHMYIIYGGVRRDLPGGFAERVEAVLQKIEERLPMVDNLIFESAVFRKRAMGVGVVPKEWADETTLSGPVVRAMGIPRDVRKDYPYLVYPELDFDVVTTEGSDIYARALVRRREIDQAIDLIRQILARMPKDGPFLGKAGNPLRWQVPAGQTYVRAEATRGEYGYFIATDGSDKIRRFHVRGPSYVHGVSLLERILPGLNISDLYPLMNSLQVCPPEIER
jgi:NADH-quinone oxidoreductase subunit D